MVRRMTRRSNVSRGTTRKFVWVRNAVFLSGTNFSTGTNLLAQFEADYGAQLIGCTVVRIRGLIFGDSDHAAASGTTDSMRLGARVLSGALNLGAAVPDQSPFVDENADWMLWEPLIHSSPVAGDGEPTLHQRVIDVKSARKIEELGEALVMFAASNPAAPTIEWAYGWDLSIGVKLP